MKKAAIIFVLIFLATASAQVTVPDWAKKVVWYQIFPERFRNGDRNNDPTAADAGVIGREWHISPWTSDWYKLQPWESEHSHRFYDNVFDRRYGGDLEGVIQKLYYLKALGVNAIYFNPIFESNSLHKYNTSTYIHVDHNFGPDPRGDLKIMAEENPADPTTWKWTAADREFLKLLKKAHELGMKVIIDGVFNHVGTDFWAFKDVVKNQQNSKFKNWFVIKSWDDSAKGTKFEYDSWWGVKSLPIFRKDTITGLVHGPYEHIMAITKRWMDPDGKPSDGVDGWRLDVPNEVPHPFWKDWRKVVKGINPNAIIIGEIWDNASVWLKGDEFDGVMNYEFAKGVVKFFVNKKMKISPSQFDSTLKTIRNLYPSDIDYVLQNLIDSHDTDRLGSMIMNPDRDFNSNNGPRNNESYIIAKPDAAGIKRQELIALFQMTYVGAPMIYYGDEAGMWGATDPDDRKPMLWADMKYDDEKSSPIPGMQRPNNKVSFNRELFNFYRKLVRERIADPALTLGSYKTLLADDSKKVFVFERVYGRDIAIVGFNLSSQAQSVEVETDSAVSRLKDVLSSKQIIPASGVFHLSIDPGWGILLVGKTP